MLQCVFYQAVYQRYVFFCIFAVNLVCFAWFSKQYIATIRLNSYLGNTLHYPQLYVILY